MIHYSNITTIIRATIAVATIAAVGCTKEYTRDNVDAGVKSILTFGATMPDTETRTSLGDKTGSNWNVVWNEGDRILVNGTPSEALTAGDAGKSSAFFSVETEEATQYQAIYPASIADSTGTLTLPAIQTYRVGQFSSGSAVMVGQSTTKSIEFKHACAYVRARLQRKGSEVLSRVCLYSYDKIAICGSFKVSDYTLGTITMTVAGTNCVSMDAANGLQYDPSGKADLIFAIPAGEYPSGLVLSVENTDGTQMVARIKSTGLTLQQGHMFSLDTKTFEGLSCPFAGEGTEANPYQISSVDDLRYLSILTNFGNTGSYTTKYYRQTADIDMDGITGYMPIAQNIEVPFTGSYDGNGKKISNLEIITTFSYTGMFGVCSDNAVIDDVTLDSPVVNGGRYYTGALVGYINPKPGKTVTCSNCTAASAKVSATGSEKHSVGGLVGKIMTDEVEGTCSCRIDGCKFAGDIAPYTNKYVGAIVGFAELNATANEFSVLNCQVDSAKISTTSDLCSANGGLVGMLLCHAPSTVTVNGNSVSNFTIEGYANYLAGCVGLIKISAENCTFNSSGNTAGKVTIKGDNSGHVGGFTGCAYMCFASDHVNIDSFTFDGTITASKHMVAGIVGDNDYADSATSNGNIAISNCKVSGDITGNYYVGGAMGLANLRKADSTFSIINTGYTGGTIECKSCGTYTAVGGIVGYAYITVTDVLDIYNCYSLPTALKVPNVESATTQTVGGILAAYKNMNVCTLYNTYSNLTLNRVYVNDEPLAKKWTRMGGIFGMLAPKKDGYAKVKYAYYDSSIGIGATATAAPTINYTEEYDFSGSKETLLTKLNNAVDAYTTGTYTLRKWELGADGYPTFASGE